MNDYLELWARWFSGEDVRNHSLFGLSVIWLARIGKIIGFLSAITLLADAIGPERLAIMRQNCHDKRKRVQKINLIIEMFRDGDVFMQDVVLNLISGFFVVALFLGVGSIISIIFYDTSEVNWLAMLWFFAFIPATVLLFLIIALLRIIILISTYFVIYSMEILAKFLSSREYCSAIAFILLLIGFHLDLLGS